MVVRTFDTLEEVADLVENLNVKICVLVGWDSSSEKWTVVDVDSTGAVKTV